jgi:hypothetical protein
VIRLIGENGVFFRLDDLDLRFGWTLALVDVSCGAG